MAASRLLTVRGHLTTTSPVRAMCSAGNHGDLTSQGAREVLSTRRSVPVLDSHMSYLDTGRGDNVVLFLHGNPTSAYLWRNIIPHVRPVARCLAPDLIGMGHSGKPDLRYTYADHYRYLSAWIELMDLPGRVSIVCHDWGSGLGFHWCNQNRDRVRSIVHMESLANVMADWESFPEVARGVFQALRSDAGEEMVLKKNFFVERLLPGSVMRKLSDEEMAEYRAPFAEEKSRLPTLTWPREIPVASDGPENVVKIAQDYCRWLASSADVPKLFVNAKPGFFSAGILKAIKDWPNQKVVDAKGLHFLQEDSPDEIGQAIKDFLEDVYKQ